MPLFPKQEMADSGSHQGRVRSPLMREKGTRNLVAGFCALLAMWYLAGKVNDYFLLRRHWPLLSAADNGLTVVGTLDARDAYDRNMFRILQIEGESRVEITDFGWRSTFRRENGPMFTDKSANAILAAISVDSETGYAMLEPFLKVGLAHFGGPPAPPVTQDMVVHVSEIYRKSHPRGSYTLGGLINVLSAQSLASHSSQPTESSSESGGGGREVEKGTSIPADTLIHVCPVIATGAHFSNSSLEESPANVFTGTAYSVHLNFTPEGRSRFYQWSYHHQNESVVFVLRHHVVTAPRIRQVLDENNWEISNVPDKIEAQALVTYLDTKGSSSR